LFDSLIIFAQDVLIREYFSQIGHAQGRSFSSNAAQTLCHLTSSNQKPFGNTHTSY